MAAFLCWLGVRLMAMHRVLRSDGSIYLHIDSTAHAYVKTMMDGIFGKKCFRNEIVWFYKNASRGKKQWARSHDTLLWYSKDFRKYTFNREEVLIPFESGMTAWRYSKGGQAGKPMPKGKTPDDVITMPSLNTMDKERMGYPTQKPLALYERIIKASSNEGGIVLDPFAGCATTLVAAERLGRQWVGMDIWKGAKEAVLDRLEKEGLATPRGAGGLLAFGDVHYSTVPPVRTDDNEVAAPNLKLEMKRAVEPWMKMTHKQISNVLVKAQSRNKGWVICAGCGRELEKEYLQLDHIKPKADNGENNISNRILLCAPCNIRKSGDLTLRGLVKENKKKDVNWMKDEKAALWAQESAMNKATWVQVHFDADECKALMQES